MRHRSLAGQLWNRRRKCGTLWHNKGREKTLSQTLPSAQPAKRLPMSTALQFCRTQEAHLADLLQALLHEALAVQGVHLQRLLLLDGGRHRLHALLQLLRRLHTPEQVFTHVLTSPLDSVKVSPLTFMLATPPSLSSLWVSCAAMSCNPLFLRTAFPAATLEASRTLTRFLLGCRCALSLLPTLPSPAKSWPRTLDMLILTTGASLLTSTISALSFFASMLASARSRLTLPMACFSVSQRSLSRAASSLRACCCLFRFLFSSATSFQAPLTSAASCSTACKWVYNSRKVQNTTFRLQILQSCRTQTLWSSGGFKVGGYSAHKHLQAC